MANPVGTGPYRLKEWRRGQKIVLEANPTFRDELYPGKQPSRRSRDRREARGQEAPARRSRRDQHHRGIESAAARLRAGRPRLRGGAARPRAERARSGNKLKPRFAKAGITLARGIQPAITYSYFNMEDPVVGGYTPDKIALRRAIGMAYNVDEEIRVLRAGSGRAGHAADAAERLRLQPEIRRPREVRSWRPRRRCSTSSATSTATRMAGAICPTASRWC